MHHIHNACFVHFTCISVVVKLVMLCFSKLSFKIICCELNLEPPGTCGMNVFFPVCSYIGLDVVSDSLSVYTLGLFIHLYINTALCFAYTKHM